VSAQILNLVPYKPGKPIAETQREYNLTEVVKLASNENALGPSPAAIKAMEKWIKEQHIYPDPSSYELVQKLSQKWSIPVNRIGIGNGSNEIIDLLIRIFCEPGDSILTSQAAFVAYQVCAQAARVQVRTVPLKEPLTLDLQAMADDFFQNSTKKIKLVFIPNPNNPTGTCVGAKEVDQFLQRLGNRDDVLLVFDEAYTEFVRDPEFKEALSFQSQYNNVIVIKTFSKVYGLAGLRLGALVAPEYVLELYNRVRNPFNVNSLAQAAGVAALDDEGYIKMSQKMVWNGLDFWEMNLQRLGLKYFPSQANFILVDLNRNAQACFEYLLRLGVILRPVANYGFPNYIRISIGLESENQKALAAIEKMLKDIPVLTQSNLKSSVQGKK
jgi:histidinol-phosphate aminotransferase